MTNPYLNPDDDADILGNAPTRNGGANLNISGIQIVGPDGQKINVDSLENIPEVLSRAMAGQISGDTNPLQTAKMTTLTNVFEYFAKTANNNPAYPLVIAMAHMLDEMTNGYFGQLLKLYQLEMQLNHQHFIKRCVAQYQSADKSARQLMESLGKDRSLPWSDDDFIAFAVAAEIADFIIVDVSVRYYELCAQLNKEPDVQLIETGYHTNPEPYSAAVLGRDVEQYDREVDEAIGRLLEKWQSLTSIKK